jgi:hypothetical protein
MDSEALNESIVFLDHFTDLEDPRQQAKVIYPLNEVLLLCLLAVLAGAETFTDIALFGEKKLHLLRRFLPCRNGTPPHDRLGEIFAVLDAEVFQRCFVSWVSTITKIPDSFNYEQPLGLSAFHELGTMVTICHLLPMSCRQRDFGSSY